MALKTITEAYAQLFDLRPLRELGIPMPNIAELPITTEEPMLPSRHAMTFVIGASIQHHIASGAHPKELFPLYERWRMHVETGQPILADLASTDHLANIFLAAFIQSPKSLLHAARVVQQ